MFDVLSCLNFVPFEYFTLADSLLSTSRIQIVHFQFFNLFAFQSSSSVDLQVLQILKVPKCNVIRLRFLLSDLEWVLSELPWKVSSTGKAWLAIVFRSLEWSL